MHKHLSIILVGLISVTAVALLWVSHEHRQLLRHWNTLEQQRLQMETHWEQLLLEQAALGAHGRIERIARDQLQMKYPRLIDQERLDYQERLDDHKAKQ